MKTSLGFLLGLAFVSCTQQSPAQRTSNATSLPPCAASIPTIVVKILSPLSTATSNAGDAFTTSVEYPAELKEAVVEGRVTAVHKPEKGFGKQKPSLQMEFTTLTQSGRSCALKAELSDVTNSQGVSNVDEEGQVIGRTSNKKRALATAGGAVGGALLGALKGGAGGAILGGAAGGAAAFVLSSTLSSVGTNIEFKPGSLFTLRLYDPNRQSNVK